jgi:uncharacterized phage-associated protein
MDGIMNSHKTFQIANHFIQKGIDDGNPVTPMKLQKLLYFAYGWYWALYDKRLFNETIQAWKFGPVVLSVYHMVKNFGNNPIKWTILDLEKMEAPVLNKKEDADVISFLDEMWKVYSKYSALELANLTHSEGTPWYDINSDMKGNIPQYYDINDEKISKYFKDMKNIIESPSAVTS